MSGSTASAPVSDVSAPACTNGLWPPLPPVSVAQNKPSIMSSSTLQSIEPQRTTRPDGSGRWDNRMAAQHLPRYLGGLAVDKRTRLNERRTGKLFSRFSTHHHSDNIYSVIDDCIDRRPLIVPNTFAGSILWILVFNVATGWILVLWKNDVGEVWDRCNKILIAR